MPLSRSLFVSGAMFDVRPVDDTGAVAIVALSPLATKVNLRHKDRKALAASVSLARTGRKKLAETKKPEREIFLKELQAILVRQSDAQATLASVGATVSSRANAGRPRYRPIMPQPSRERQHMDALRAIRTPISHDIDTPSSYDVPVDVQPVPVEAPITTLVADINPSLNAAAIDVWLEHARPRNSHVSVAANEVFSGLRSLLPWILSAALVIAGLLSVSRYGLQVKSKVIMEGSAGVQNLTDAKESLQKMDFAAAAGSFASAYEEFSRAGEQLNVVSLGLGSFIGSLPGGSQFASANNLIAVGKLVADSGKAMTDAVQALAKTGLILNPRSSPRVIFPEVLGALRSALALSDQNLRKASMLLASVNESTVPEDKRAALAEFKEKLPEIQQLVAQSSGYAEFLQALVGSASPKRYLLLFQNSSELRPTGGFPGTYGVVTFQNGQLKDFSVDDVYNLDGQLRDLIVPPLQLQHITPNWAMRDAGWFIDFPASAKKAMGFFRKEAGYDVDGVITVNPKLVSNILGIIGPISMPEYNLTLNSDNFLAEVQAEVEYGKNKEQNKPKQIVTDLAPRLLLKLYSADQDSWLKVLQAFTGALERKDILMYFRDAGLERFVTEHGFAGQVLQSEGDYLMVTFSNIKGSKTDAVIDSSVKQAAVFGDGVVTHTLTITRRHNGGRDRHGFYNRQSPAYVRVLVPDSAELTGISGNTNISFSPLMDYAKIDFLRDPDLVKLEESSSIDRSKSVTVYRESGKTGFGFWMVTDPGEIKTVELVYTVPTPLTPGYVLTVQKQPGLDLSSFEFMLRPPQGSRVTSSTPELQNIAGQYIVSGRLDRDITLRAEFER